MRERLKGWAVAFLALPPWGQRLVWKLALAVAMASCIFIHCEPAHTVCREVAIGFNMAGSELPAFDGGLP